MFRERFKEDDLFQNLDVEIPMALPSKKSSSDNTLPPPKPRPSRARRAPVMKPSVGGASVRPDALSGTGDDRAPIPSETASAGEKTLTGKTSSFENAGENRGTGLRGQKKLPGEGRGKISPGSASGPARQAIPGKAATTVGAAARSAGAGGQKSASQASGTARASQPLAGKRQAAAGEASAEVGASRVGADTAKGKATQGAAAYGAAAQGAVAPGTKAPGAAEPRTSAMGKLPEKEGTENRTKNRRRSVGKTVLRVVLRTLLVIVLLAALAVTSLAMILDEVFNGPSETAREVLTMSLIEASATKWIPAKFIGEEAVEKIRRKEAQALPEEKSDPSIIQIQDGSISGGGSDRFAGHPDGIVIEEVSGDTFNAYVMLIRDPSSVYLAASSPRYSKSLPGTRINKQIELEGAIAAINGGAFFDDGTSSSMVGSVPCGLVVSKGRVLWDDGDSYEGFVGFNEDHVMVVAKTMSSSEAKELKIRDGCCFGPVLIMNGQVSEEAYNTTSGYNPRTAVGQCADGTVIFLCVDGRQAGSLGATYADIIDIFVHYGAVNACNLDGGSSTVMLYRDAQGLYGEAGKVQMINNYSLLQAEPRRMPTFFMVRPAGDP